MSGPGLSKYRFPYGIWLDRNWVAHEPSGSARIDDCLIDCSGGLAGCYGIPAGKHVSFYPSEAALDDGQSVEIPVYDRASFQMAYRFARTWTRLTFRHEGARP